MRAAFLEINEVISQSDQSLVSGSCWRIFMLWLSCVLVLSEVCDSIVLALYIVSLLMSQRTVVPAVFGAADILSALDEVV